MRCGWRSRFQLCKALKAVVRFLILPEGQHEKPVYTPVGVPPSVFGGSIVAIMGSDTWVLWLGVWPGVHARTLDKAKMCQLSMLAREGEVTATGSGLEREEHEDRRGSQEKIESM